MSPTPLQFPTWMLMAKQILLSGITMVGLSKVLYLFSETLPSMETLHLAKKRKLNAVNDQKEYMLLISMETEKQIFWWPIELSRNMMVTIFQFSEIPVRSVPFHLILCK